MFHNYQLKPMLLEEVNEPFNDKNFLYEIKFDGIRALIYVSKNSFKILSRNGTNLTNKYPELKKIQKLVGNHEIIFDGEIIATEGAHPSFSLLQKRNKIKKITDKIIEEVPVTFIAFDILYDNVDLTNLSLDKRKKILGQYPDNSVFIKSRIYSDGLSLFKMVKKIGLEGIVAKKRKSIYLFGKRTSDWVKVKNIHVDNFIVHGYLEKTNTYSLLLGEYKNNKLKYVGKVSVNKRHEVMRKIKKSKKVNNSFVNFLEDAIYVEPTISVRVRYLEKHKSGALRHATLDE
mgnify:FL=1